MAKGDRRRKQRGEDRGENLPGIGETGSANPADSSPNADSTSSTSEQAQTSAGESAGHNITELSHAADPVPGTSRDELASSPADDGHAPAILADEPSQPASPGRDRPRGRLQESGQSGTMGGTASTDPNPAPMTKPVALTEVLANPTLSMRAIGAASTEPPATENTPTLPRPEFTSERPRAKTAERAEHPRNQQYPGNQNVASEVTSHSEPSYAMDTVAPRSRETIIIAILVLMLIVLGYDTYRLYNLNGIAPASSGTPVTSNATRPWVGVDNLRTQPFANGGQPVTTVHIVNSGREPAYDLRSNTVGSLRSSNTPPPEVPTQMGPPATTGLLLPNTGGNLTFFANTRALTAEEAGSVRSGQYVLWLAGRLDYKDAAGHRHLTTFRYRYNPAANSFVAAPQGNMAN